jgi:hypothetical protein
MSHKLLIETYVCLPMSTASFGLCRVFARYNLILFNSITSIRNSVRTVFTRFVGLLNMKLSEFCVTNLL